MWNGETGHVNHRLKEIKDDAWATVWKRWVVVRGRLDPTATFLFLVDKGALAHTVIFSPSLFALCISFSLFSVFHLPLPVFCLCHATKRRVWAPQPPRGATLECQILVIHLRKCACLCGTRPCGSFKPLLEKHGCREVNGKLKQNAPACCAVYSLWGGQSRGCWEVL